MTSYRMVSWSVLAKWSPFKQKTVKFNDKYQIPQKTHRSRSASGRHQRCCGAGEVHSPWASEYFAPMVGAAAFGGGAGGNFCPDGERPRLSAGAGLWGEQEGSGDQAGEVVRDHPRAGQVGEYQ